MGHYQKGVTALKWTITTQERNALVETHLGCIWWTINKNRRLISAAGLDDEDVFQQLAIRPAYDPELAQKRVQEGLRRRGRKKEGNANV